MLNRSIAPPVHAAVDFQLHLTEAQQTTFKNGINLYALNAGTQDVVLLEWVFKGGLWAEKQTGVAYATSALLKNGTRHKTEKEISETLEFYGASLRSTANNDFSSLQLYCLSKHLPQLLPIVQEIIFEASFPKEELEIYRTNALQTLLVNLKKVDFVANRIADAQVFGEQHPYGRYRKKQDYENLAVERLRAYHNRVYTSANCTLFLSGRFENKAIQDIASFFGNENWGGTATPILFDKAVSIPAKNNKQQIKIEEDTVQGAVRILRPFPTSHHPDYAPMVLLNTVLGGYFGSRLMDNIREQKGYTYGIYSTIYSYHEAATLTISTEAGREVCPAVVEEIFKEMNRLQSELIPNEELALVKNYLFGQLLAALDGPFQMMSLWRNLILSGFDKSHFDDNLRIYRETTPNQLLELAKKYFNSNDFYEVVVI